MVADIEIISKEFIKPSFPTPYANKEHKLSFLDQFQVPIYLPLIFFYKNQSCSNITDQSRRSQHLKLSLADALTKLYHLAGRIRRNVSIDCNDSGALLLEAQVHATLSQGIQNAPIDELDQYLPLEPYADPSGVNNAADVRLLAIQLNFFECGSTAIGVCISHKIGDAASLVMFVNYWAVLNRGEKIHDHLSQPCCDLAIQLFPGVDEDSPFPKFDGNVGKEKMVSKKFLFDKEKLAALKELASSEDCFGLQVKDPTRLEVVSAFIWKQFIDISRAKGSNKSLFMASHAVNLRTRMKSLLPSDHLIDNAFGNFSIGTYDSITPWALGNHFQELLWSLRIEIRRTNDDYIKLVQSGVPYLNAFLDARRRLPDPREMDYCFFSSWCRFPLYDADFGWGKPVVVCTTAMKGRNAVVLMSTTCGDGIEAGISMSEDEMGMLPDDLLSLQTTTNYY